MVRLMHKIIATIFFIFGWCVLGFSQENITITTYYPSPYGSYNELQLFPHHPFVTPCNATTRGTMYIDSNDGFLYVCDGAGWKIFSGLWGLTGTNLYPKNNAWNVGIGTNNPTRGKLEIDQTANTNAGGIGLLNSSAGQSLRLWIDNSNIGHLDVGSAGTGNLSINAGGAGRVGIGTTSPRTTLEVDGGGIIIHSTGAMPGCGAATRGLLWYEQTAAPDDKLWLCQHQSGGAYGWYRINICPCS